MSEIQLPSHWKVVKLGDEKIATTSSGGTPNRSKPEFFGGDIRWVKSGELDDNWVYDTEEKITQQGLEKSSAKIFPAGTLLLALYGATAGKTAILGVEAATNQAVCAIFPVNYSFDSQFIQFYLIFIRSQILSARTGGAQPNISQRVIKLLDIILPPFPEQKAIAHTLRTIQKSKEARQRELELERERKAALMQYLFTYGTRNELRKQTEIGEIPESWQVVQLRNVCLGEPQNGAFVKNPKWGTGTLFVNVVDTYKNPVVNLKTVERLECEESLLERYSLKEYDLLFVRSSLKREGVAQCCLVEKIEETSIFDCHIIRVSPNQVLIEPFYLTYYFLSESGKNDLIARSKTTTMTTINQNNLMESLLPLPSLPEQRVIAKVLHAFDTKITAIKKEISTLDELFRAILEELMTGRLSALPLVEVNV